MIIAVLLLLAPVLATIASVIVSGTIAPATAIVSGLLAPAGAALLHRTWRDGVERITRQLMGWTATPDQPLSNPGPRQDDSLADLAGAVASVHRSWLRREKRLQDLVAANEMILESLPDPLILIDGSRRVVRANVAARNLLGERMTDRDLTATLRNPTVLEAVDTVLAGGASRTIEFTMPVPVERTYEARVKPFRRLVTEPDDPASRGEESLRVLVMLHNITAIKRSEQMRADFVANASHELRTPLATLIGFIETLRGSARDDAAARDHFLAIMHQQATRMSRLIQDLMSLSRIELDENVPPSASVDIESAVRTAVGTLELKATSRRIRIRVECSGDVPPVIGDEDQLVQVMTNLIGNAITYAHDQTEVTVRIALTDAAHVGGIVSLPRAQGRRADRSDGKMVSVAVIDRGDGIDRTHLPRLTERFYRVDPARSRALGGTGLGLAIVKHIINRHRGRLTIESEVGKGSTFTVHLPVASPEMVSILREEVGAA